MSSLVLLERILEAIFNIIHIARIAVYLTRYPYKFVGTTNLLDRFN